MEEDINYLEDYIERIKYATREMENYFKNSKRKPVRVINDNKDLIQAIENLIKGYKELRAITQAYNSYLQDSNCKTKIVIADTEYFVKGYFKENFIPKSKVKEKIEELDKEIKDLTVCVCARGSGKTSKTVQQILKNERRNALQELLEEEV